VIWREIGEAGLADYIARLVVTTAIGNGDMHLKNWSVIYPGGRTPQLAPIYDYVSTLTYVRHEKLGLNLGGSRRFEDVSLDSFISLANRIKAPARLVANIVKSTVDRIHSEWAGMKKDTDLPRDIIDSVTRQIDTLPLFRN
jgi:serine/threonine-protein kinase HipA